MSKNTDIVEVQPIPNIYQRLAVVNKTVQAITKDQTNQQQHFKFRGIDQVLAEIHGLFAENEIFITQKVIDQKREERASKSGGLNIWTIVTYQFNFNAPDGSSIPTEMVGEAMDSGDKGNNKCVSIALKYALIDMFTIPTKEQQQADPDSNTVELGLSLTPAEQQVIMQQAVPEELRRVCREMLNTKGKPYSKLIKDMYDLRNAQLELLEVK